MRHKYKKNPAALVLAGLYSNAHHWLTIVEEVITIIKQDLSVLA